MKDIQREFPKFFKGVSKRQLENTKNFKETGLCGSGWKAPVGQWPETRLRKRWRNFSSRTKFLV